MKSVKRKIEEKDRKSAKIVGFTALTLILLTGTMFYSTTEARAEIDWAELASVGCGAAGGAALGFAAADGPGAVVGAAVGAIGALLLWMFADETPKNALNSEAQSEFAENLRIQEQNEMNLSHSNALNMYTLFNTSVYYFVRKGEWAAKELYDSGESYSSWKVLEESQVSIGALAYYYGSAATYSNVLSAYGTVGNYYIGTYEGMYTELYAHNNEGTYKIHAKTDTAHEFKALNIMKIEPNKYYFFGSYPIYIVAQKNMTYNIKAVDSDGNLIPLYYPDDDITSTNRSIHMYPMDFIRVNITTEENTTVYAKFVFDSPYEESIFAYAAPDIENAGYLYPALLGFELNKNTGDITLPYAIWYNPDTSLSYDIRFSYMYPLDGIIYTADPYSIGLYNRFSTGSTKVSLTQMFTDEAKILKQVSTMLSTVNSFSYATYVALENGQMSDTPVFPDIIFPDPQQLEKMNATDAYAAWIAYMRQLYYDMQNKSVSDYRNVNISAESFKNLRVIGTIQDQNGTYIAGSNSSYAVFIPYISIKDMNLTKGTNIMNQSGFVLVLKEPWYKNTTEGMEIGQLTYIPLKPNYILNVTAIELDGKQTDYVLLTTTKLEFVIPQLSGPAAPPEYQTLGEALVDWFTSHILTSAFLFAGLGALILLPAPSNKTWGFILLVAAAAMYFFVEPVLADPWGALSGLLGLQINYWRW